tara:strand:- start:56 stop:232 length:177 start_codon:yes stop_codon:yes gene_type:complete
VGLGILDGTLHPLPQLVALPLLPRSHPACRTDGSERGLDTLLLEAQMVSADPQIRAAA